MPSGNHIHRKFNPLNPTLFSKTGYAGVNMFSYFLIDNIDCGYTSMFWSKNKKNRYTPAYPSFVI